MTHVCTDALIAPRCIYALHVSGGLSQSLQGILSFVRLVNLRALFGHLCHSVMSHHNIAQLTQILSVALV